MVKKNQSSEKIEKERARLLKVIEKEQVEERKIQFKKERAKREEV